MPKYLIELSYTSEAWTHQIENQQHVLERAKPAVESFGGRVECIYYSFGEYDLVCIVEFPDHLSAAASQYAISSSGILKSSRATPLISIEEGQAAMMAVGVSSYKPPRPPPPL